MKTNFEKLEVYKLSENLADQIWNAVIKWKQFEKDALGLQMIRAADSVGANIAEGNGRFNFADNNRFVRISRGSLYELKHFLRRAYKRQLLTEKEIESIKKIMDVLSPKLNAYLKSIGTKGNQKTTNNCQLSNSFLLLNLFIRIFSTF